MRKQRRQMAGAAAALLAAGLLTGCGGSQNADTVTSLKIGVSVYDQYDTFLAEMMTDMAAELKNLEQETNIQITMEVVNAGHSQLTQNDQVQDFLDSDYDILCVNLVDRTDASTIIDKAKNADTPVIFFNREPVEEDLRRWRHAYYVGLPAGDAGVLQGELVLDAWENQREKLDRNGDGVIQYVMLEGEPGHQDALLRTEYCISTMTKAGVATEKLASDAANWQRGQAAIRMRQWLREFGEDIEVVFANNDDMALGAIDACTEAGEDKDTMPFIVGVDATPPALEALREGTLMGTVRNDATGLAESIMGLAVSLSAGGEPAREVELTDGSYVWLRYEAVTAETLED